MSTQPGDSPERTAAMPDPDAGEPPPPMRVLIFETDHHGHRLVYVRHLLEALEALPVEVTVLLSRDAQQSPEFDAHLGPIVEAGGVTVLCSEPVIRGHPRTVARQRLRALRDAVARLRPDHVYLPTADGLAQAMGVDQLRRPRWGTEFEAVMHRGAFAYPYPTRRQRLQAWLGLRMLRLAPLGRVHFVDWLPYARLQREGGDLSRRTGLMPDPIDPAPPVDPNAARRGLGLPIEGRYIGCAGQINARKGIDHLLHAFAAAPRRPDDRLLLVGRHEPAIKRRLQTDYAPLCERGTIWSIDRFVSAEELHLAMCAMNVVCTPYPCHRGIASIVVRAAEAGRPVLGSDFGWIGATLPRFGLGWTTPVTDRAAFAAAIEKCLDAAPAYRPSEAARRFTAFHTVANFQATLTARLRERLGLPGTDALRPWEWVEAATPGA